MSHLEIIPYQENLQLRKSFKSLALDLPAVMEFTPFDLEMENGRFRQLLNFVNKYNSCKSRKTMELMDGAFPPIFPSISPESDWQRFELWIQGKEVSKKLRAQLPKSLHFISPDKLVDDQLPFETERLMLAMYEQGYSIELVDELPLRLLYEYLWQILDDDFDLDDEGGWVIDGCSGYCPGCIQRPWCDAGLENCWPEDLKAGKMHLPEELDSYVSPSPNSLKVLEQYIDKDAFPDPKPPFRDSWPSPIVLPTPDFQGDPFEMPINEN